MCYFVSQNGQTIVIEACVKAVTCKNGVLVDKPLRQCSVYAECHAQGTQCQCREGYSGDGYTCECHSHIFDSFCLFFTFGIYVTEYPVNIKTRVCHKPVVLS